MSKDKRIEPAQQQPESDLQTAQEQAQIILTQIDQFAAGSIEANFETWLQAVTKFVETINLLSQKTSYENFYEIEKKLRNELQQKLTDYAQPEWKAVFKNRAVISQSWNNLTARKAIKETLKKIDQALEEQVSILVPTIFSYLDEVLKSISPTTPQPADKNYQQQTELIQPDAETLAAFTFISHYAPESIVTTISCILEAFYYLLCAQILDNEIDSNEVQNTEDTDANILKKITEITDLYQHLDQITTSELSILLNHRQISCAAFFVSAYSTLTRLDNLDAPQAFEFVDKLLPQFLSVINEQYSALLKALQESRTHTSKETKLLHRESTIIILILILINLGIYISPHVLLSELAQTTSSVPKFAIDELHRRAITPYIAAYNTTVALKPHTKPMPTNGPNLAQMKNDLHPNQCPTPVSSPTPQFTTASTPEKLAALIAADPFTTATEQPSDIIAQHRVHHREATQPINFHIPIFNDVDPITKNQILAQAQQWWLDNKGANLPSNPQVTVTAYVEAMTPEEHQQLFEQIKTGNLNYKQAILFEGPVREKQPELYDLYLEIPTTYAPALAQYLEQAWSGWLSDWGRSDTRPPDFYLTAKDMLEYTLLTQFFLDHTDLGSNFYQLGHFTFGFDSETLKQAQMDLLAQQEDPHTFGNLTGQMPATALAYFEAHQLEGFTLADFFEVYLLETSPTDRNQDANQLLLGRLFASIRAKHDTANGHLGRDFLRVTRELIKLGYIDEKEVQYLGPLPRRTDHGAQVFINNKTTQEIQDPTDLELVAQQFINTMRSFFLSYRVSTGSGASIADINKRAPQTYNRQPEWEAGLKRMQKALAQFYASPGGAIWEKMLTQNLAAQNHRRHTAQAARLEAILRGRPGSRMVTWSEE